MAIRNGNKVLVQNRVNPDWPGITFPGGHVERGESFVDAVIRGSERRNWSDHFQTTTLQYQNWYDDKDYRYVVLYKTNTFLGELQSSDEGKVWWEDFDNLSHLKLATDDVL